MSAKITLFAALIGATALTGCVESGGGYYDGGYRGPAYNDGYRGPSYDDRYRGPVVVERARPRPQRDYYRDRRGDRREAERDRRESDRRDRRDDRSERRDDRRDRRDDRSEQRRDRPERVERPSGDRDRGSERPRSGRLAACDLSDRDCRIARSRDGRDPRS